MSIGLALVSYAFAGLASICMIGGIALLSGDRRG